MSDDEDYFIPLQDQRVFGAGLKRKRVQFVPASSDAVGASLSSSSSSAQNLSVSDAYLRLVLSRSAPTATASTSAAVSARHGDRSPPSPASPPAHHDAAVVAESPAAAAAAAAADAASAEPAPTCATYRLPLVDGPPSSAACHSVSLAHQVALPHSHPPSALDRTRRGFAYMAAHGWDPDARRGLGARGEGVLHPVRARAKDDRLGIGARVPREVTGRARRVGEAGPVATVAAARRGEARDGADRRLKGSREKEREKRSGKMDAGRVRRAAERDRRRGEELRDMFYGDEAVERLLYGD